MNRIIWTLALLLPRLFCFKTFSVYVILWIFELQCKIIQMQLLHVALDSAKFFSSLPVQYMWIPLQMDCDVAVQLFKHLSVASTSWMQPVTLNDVAWHLCRTWHIAVVHAWSTCNLTATMSCHFRIQPACTCVCVCVCLKEDSNRCANLRNMLCIGRITLSTQRKRKGRTAAACSTLALQLTGLDRPGPLATGQRTREVST